VLYPRLTTANIAQIIKGRNAIGRKRQGHQLRSIHSGWHCSYCCSLVLAIAITFKMADISKDALRKEITGK
jgi:hypothetical protein